MAKEKEKAKNADKPKKVEKTRFDAKFFWYSLYCFVLFLIELITLGTTAPFCECKRRKYIAKHAIIDNTQLKFAGRSKKLIKKNLWWSFLTIITLGLYGLVRRVKMEKWIIKKTKFDERDEREGKSYFCGKSTAWLWLGVKRFFVAVLSLGIAYPVTLYWKHKYFVEHTVVSGKAMLTSMTIADEYKYCLKNLALFICTIGLYSIVYLPYAKIKFNISKITLTDAVGNDYDDEDIEKEIEKKERKDKAKKEREKNKKK